MQKFLLDFEKRNSKYKGKLSLKKNEADSLPDSGHIAHAPFERPGSIEGV
jgi:hypothetical protein